MSKLDNSQSLYGTAKAEKPLQTQNKGLPISTMELAKADDPLTEEQKQRIEEGVKRLKMRQAIKEMQE